MDHDDTIDHAEEEMEEEVDEEEEEDSTTRCVCSDSSMFCPIYYTQKDLKSIKLKNLIDIFRRVWFHVTV